MTIFSRSRASALSLSDIRRAVVSKPEVDVAVAVAETLDDTGYKIRGGFGDDGGPLLEDGIDSDDPTGGQARADDGVEEDGKRNRQDAAEEIAHDHRARKPAKGIVAGEVDAVGQSHEGVELIRMGGRGDAEAPIENDGFYQIVEQRHREAGVEQGIGQAVPTDVTVPAQKR
jgi:hypothetical protein